MLYLSSAYENDTNPIIGPRCEKTCLRDLRPTKAQKSIVSKLASREISVAKETGKLSLALSETPKTVFFAARPNFIM